MEVEYQYTTGSQISKIIARDITKGTSTDIYCMEYEYDENGRKVKQVTKEKESDADTSAYYVTTFNYDSRDMLTEEKYQRWDSGNTKWDVMYWGRYMYDIAGNMVKREVDQIVNGAQKTYKDDFNYSRGYQLTSIERDAVIYNGLPNWEERTFNLTYDANGNLTHIDPQGNAFSDSWYEITEMEFQFDEKNRMTNYRFGGAGSYYAIKYDSLGRVRERVDLTPTTTKYYSDGRQLIQQMNDSNNVEFDYFRGPTGLMRQWEENGTPTKRFYIKDPLGTVWALVDPSNLTVKRYNYNAWGEHLDKDDTDFPTDTNYMRYIGSRYEAFGDSTAQTDAIYLLGPRHYIPVLNSFLQRDLLTRKEGPFVIFPLTLAPYIYAYDSPSIFSDPTGFSPCFGGGDCQQPPELKAIYPPLGKRGRCCVLKDPNLNWVGGGLWWRERLDSGIPMQDILDEYFKEFGGKLPPNTWDLIVPLYFHAEGTAVRRCYFRERHVVFDWECVDLEDEICHTLNRKPCYHGGPSSKVTSGDWLFNPVETPFGYVYQCYHGIPFTVSLTEFTLLKDPEYFEGEDQDWCRKIMGGFGPIYFCGNPHCPCDPGTFLGFWDYVDIFLALVGSAVGIPYSELRNYYDRIDPDSGWQMGLNK